MKLSKIFLATFLLASTVFFSCAPKDADVQAKITEKFAATPELTGVSATVEKGVATLTGEVKDATSVSLADSVAKGIKGVKSVVNNTTVIAPPPPPAPVATADDTLTKGVTDATKDFPGVTAMVNNGEITLTGTITRSNLQTLMQTLNTLGAKKINNQLTIK